MNAAQFSGALGKVDDKYIMEAVSYKGKKKRGRMKWAAMAACVCLIFTAAVVTLPGILKGPIGDSSGTQPLQSPGQGEVIINWNDVAVNESEGFAPDAARLYRDPALYEKEIWGQREIAAYYGRALNVPYVPEGLSGGGKAVTAVICRDKATGEIVEDQVSRGFWADFWEDGSPKSDDEIVIPKGFTVTASRLGILRCGLLPVEEERTTDFGGVPVTLSHCSLPYGPFDPERKAPDGLHNMPAGYYDIYVASFTLEGVEYEISAERLDLEEVVKIAASMINTPYSENFTVGGAQNLPEEGSAPAE